MAERSSDLMGVLELWQDEERGQLWTGPVPVVRGRGWPPLTEMRLEVHCLDDKGRPWRSRNDFLVNADGEFDTSLTASVGEDYYGIAPEGPLTAMSCLEGAGHEFSWKACQPLRYRWTVSCDGRTLWSQEAERHLVPPAASERPALAQALLFDEPSEAVQAALSTLFAAYGVALGWVSSQARLGEPLPWPVADERLPRFLIGCGRFSGQTLETARRSPGLAGVMLFSGSGLRFAPLVTTEGETLPSIAVDHAALRPRAEGLLATRSMYAEAVADRGQREAGRIAVEEVRCPIHLFTGLDDQIWPASAFSELIVQRRKKSDCPFLTSHRTFEAVGHDLGPTLGLPSLPTTERTVAHPETSFRLLLGGKPGRQARARRECWQSMMGLLTGCPEGGRSATSSVG